MKKVIRREGYLYKTGKELRMERRIPRAGIFTDISKGENTGFFTLQPVLRQEKIWLFSRRRKERIKSMQALWRLFKPFGYGKISAG